MSIDQIAWKTNAWKSTDMVAGYARSVADMSGPNLIKNRVETDLFRKYAQGKDVLDVGVGTGRASIPLARAGYALTGVDSSEAMLRKCRELAAGTDLQLIQGDVASLPFRDETFDTVMALNTIAHFPHWQEIIREWGRVLRPNGRMIFDMFSMDHDVGYARAVGEPPEWGIERFAPNSVESFYLRLPVVELAGSLEALGLKIDHVVPYGVFSGTKGYNRFFEGSVLSGFAWDRLLSWAAADSQLFDFLIFLEQEFVSNLTSVAACRYMVVLKKAPVAGANARWLQRNNLYNAALAKGLSLDTIARNSSIDREAFFSKLQNFIKHPPNRFALARILIASLAWRWPVALDEFFDEPDLRKMRRIMELARLDIDVTSMLQRFHRTDDLLEDFTYRGVPIGPTLEYHAMAAILDKAYGVFENQVLAEDEDA